MSFPPPKSNPAYLRCLRQFNHLDPDPAEWKLRQYRKNDPQVLSMFGIFSDFRGLQGTAEAPPPEYLVRNLWASLMVDEFPHYSTWPSVWRRLFFKSHKDRNERYRLYMFFFQNGMFPSRAYYWVVIHGGYDFYAHSSLAALMVETQTRQGGHERNRTYNFNLGRVD